MKIFITGGTGFIGASTVPILLKSGHNVLLVSRGNLKPLACAQSKKLTFLKGDLSEPEKFWKKAENFQPDAALHLAWESIPNYSADASIKNFETGLRLIRLLTKAHCPKIVVAGSCWEYGNVQGRIKETAASMPVSAFSAAKLALYYFGREIAKENNINLIWARLFFVYGPGQKSTSLVPHLLLCKNRKAAPVVKNPAGVNDMIFVEDAARALVALIETPRLKHDLYNIGSGRLTAVQTVMRKIFGDIPARISCPNIPDKGLYADITRITQETSWRPTVGINAGLKETAAWFLAMYGARKPS